MMLFLISHNYRGSREELNIEPLGRKHEHGVTVLNLMWQTPTLRYNLSELFQSLKFVRVDGHFDFYVRSRCV